MKDDDRCPECKQILKIGDYPFCSASGHSTIYSKNASTAPPTVVFRNSKGEYRFPGRDTDKPPRGFQKVVLDTQRKRDKFEKEAGRAQNEAYRETLRRTQQIWEGNIARAEERLREIASNSKSDHTKKFVEVCLADAQKRRSRIIANMEAGFHIESNHFSSSNRQPWQDRDTGWKPRK